MAWKYVPLVVADSIGELDGPSPSNGWMGYVVETGQFFERVAGVWTEVESPVPEHFHSQYSEVGHSHPHPSNISTDTQFDAKVNIADKLYIGGDRGVTGVKETPIGTLTFKEGVLTNFENP